MLVPRLMGSGLRVYFNWRGSFPDNGRSRRGHRRCAPGPRTISNRFESEVRSRVVALGYAGRDAGPATRPAAEAGASLREEPLRQYKD